MNVSTTNRGRRSRRGPALQRIVNRREDCCMRQGQGTERPRRLAARSMRPAAFLSAILLFLTDCGREKKSTTYLIAAATEGAKLRFRPIMMTAFAFILGVLPLVMAHGAARARASASALRCSRACCWRPRWACFSFLCSTCQFRVALTW